MNAEAAFMEIFEDRDSGESDFEDFSSGSFDDGDGISSDDEAACVRGIHSHETGNASETNGDDRPMGNRQQGGRAGGANGRIDDFRRAYRDDWLPKFSHPSGQLILRMTMSHQNMGFFLIFSMAMLSIF